MNVDDRNFEEAIERIENIIEKNCIFSAIDLEFTGIKSFGKDSE